MRPFLKIITVFLALAIAGSVLAQGPGGGGNDIDHPLLNSAMDRTQQVIEKARRAVSETDSQRARNLLQVAINLQDKARRLNTPMAGMMDLRTAGKFTLMAREKAQEAITVARQEDRNDEFVRRKLEQTDQMLNRIRERIGPETPENILTIFDSAEEKQDRAHELYRNEHLKMALKMTLQAQKAVERLAENVGGYHKARNNYNALMERYFLIRDKVELGGFQEMDEVRNRMEQIEKMRREAEEMAGQGHYVRAEHMIQRAVENISRLGEKLKEPARLEQAYRNTMREIERHRENILGSGNEYMIRLYREALEHMEKARNQYDQGNFEASAIQLQAARQNMHAVIRLLEG